MKIKSVMLRLSVWVLLLAFGCSNDPKPINYGEDACVYCKMTIVDKQHSSQVVTKKGRTYNYDAIECMLNAQKNWEGSDVAIFRVADFDEPGSMTDATVAHYLISKNLPSPMGGFLSAFKNQAKRNSILDEYGGESLDWRELLARY